MKIGIIGAGNIGGALAQRFTEMGHDVSIANSRGPDTLREVEAETGATAVRRIATRLSDLRAAAGVSRRELAARCGLHAVKVETKSMLAISASGRGLT